jgi:hypothetical protein
MKLIIKIALVRQGHTTSLSALVILANCSVLFFCQEALKTCFGLVSRKELANDEGTKDRPNLDLLRQVDYLCERQAAENVWQKKKASYDTSPTNSQSIRFHYKI